MLKSEIHEVHSTVASRKAKVNKHQEVHNAKVSIELEHGKFDKEIVSVIRELVHLWGGGGRNKRKEKYLPYSHHPIKIKLCFTKLDPIKVSNIHTKIKFI